MLPDYASARADLPHVSYSIILAEATIKATLEPPDCRIPILFPHLLHIFRITMMYS